MEEKLKISKVDGERMKKIKDLREESGLSKKDLALKFNVDEDSISQWEEDQLSITGEYLKKLALYFKVTSDEILGFKH